MRQTILLLLTLAMLAAFLYGLHYRAQKEMQYKNDERWHLIQLKAGQIAYHYFQGLVVLIAVGITYLLFLPEPVLISLEKALTTSFNLIILGQLIEAAALKYYDRQM